MISQAASIDGGTVLVEASTGPHSLKFFADTLADRLGGDKELTKALALDTLKRARHSFTSNLMYKFEQKGMPEVSVLIAHEEGLL